MAAELREGRHRLSVDRSSGFEFGRFLCKVDACDRADEF